MKIQNLIFDFGNVLISFDPQEFLARHFSDANIRKELYELIFKSREWVDLDRGKLSIAAVQAIFIQRRPDLAAQIKTVFQFWLELFNPIPETVDLALELHSLGYPLYVLSNCIHESYEHIRRHAEFLDRFQGIVVSCDLGYVKPEKEIYEHLLQKYRLQPESCLFIDDVPANVAGAVAVGIPAVQFTTLEQLRVELCRLGIL